MNGRTLRDMIISICTHNQECADDDKKLIATIWEREGWRGNNIYHNLCNVTSPETIRRTRQRLVQEGIIRPSQNATKRRKHCEVVARERLGYL
ncbi:MAG: hypothetical protein Q4E47_01215 [Candidatus Saccharibacteria bacterium]|nr:hypothetical protein [Candidatus Saccharibacteria bacterium]